MSLGCFHIWRLPLEKNRRWSPISAGCWSVGSISAPPSFESSWRAAQATYDIVFVQPLITFGRMVRLPAARRRGEPLTARSWSNPARCVISRDLKGAVLALPPAEAAVSHLTKMALLDAGLNPHQHLTLQHTKSHDSCLQRLLIGAVDACGTAAGPVRFFQARMKVSFRVLGKSRTIPHALIAVHSRVPENERERLRQTIISWQDSADGRQLLARGEHKPFQVVTDAEYNVVRQYWQRLKP